MRKIFSLTALALSVLGASAMSAAAEDTVKIGYIDPLSGGGASVGARMVFASAITASFCC